MQIGGSDVGASAMQTLFFLSSLVKRFISSKCRRTSTPFANGAPAIFLVGKCRNVYADVFFPVLVSRAQIDPKRTRFRPHFELEMLPPSKRTHGTTRAFERTIGCVDFWRVRVVYNFNRNNLRYFLHGVVVEMFQPASGRLTRGWPFAP